MAERPRQFPVEIFEQIALVMALGESVDDREPIDFFVIFCFEIAAAKKTIDAIADAQIFTVAQF